MVVNLLHIKISKRLRDGACVEEVRDDGRSMGATRRSQYVREEWIPPFFTDVLRIPIERPSV